MKKYIVTLQRVVKHKNITSGGASYKAPKDIETIAIANGYKKCIVKICTSNHPFNNLLYTVLQLIKISFQLEKNSIILFQYPEFSPIIYSIVLPFYHRFIKVVLIHDINSIRVRGQLGFVDRNNLKSFDDIIVHSNAMKQILENSIGLKKYHILDYFPYIAKSNTGERKYSKNICFAGNIYKSGSIIEFFNHLGDCKLFLYMKLKSDLELNNRTIYKGHFNPDIIQNIEGSWGLIWDGDNMNDCTGYLGAYTKLNAPHKFSMYSIAHLPVIVWEKSAIANLVKDKNIGITISSLLEIESIIDAISPTQYDVYVKNIIQFASDVESGKNFINILNSIEDCYNE